MNPDPSTVITQNLQTLLQGPNDPAVAIKMRDMIDSWLKEQVTEMRLCELRFVGLRPNQLYRFTVDPNCSKCVEDAKPYASEVFAEQ